MATKKSDSVPASVPFERSLDELEALVQKMEKGDLSLDDSLAAYERGAADADTGADCMRRALDLCHRRNWQSKLRRLYDLPGWSDALLEPGGWGGPDATAIAAAAGDWPGVMQASWNCSSRW